MSEITTANKENVSETTFYLKIIMLPFTICFSTKLTSRTNTANKKFDPWFCIQNFFTKVN